MHIDCVFQMGLTEFLSTLGENQFFGGGLGLGLIGFATAVGKKGTEIGWILFRRHKMTTVEVTCKDKSFHWLLQWLTKKGDKGTTVLKHFSFCPFSSYLITKCCLHHFSKKINSSFIISLEFFLKTYKE